MNSHSCYRMLCVCVCVYTHERLLSISPYTVCWYLHFKWHIPYREYFSSRAHTIINTRIANHQTCIFSTKMRANWAHRYTSFYPFNYFLTLCLFFLLLQLVSLSISMCEIAKIFAWLLFIKCLSAVITCRCFFFFFNFYLCPITKQKKCVMQNQSLAETKDRECTISLLFHVL